MKKLLLLMTTLFLSLSVNSQTFEVRIEEGIYMKFKVLDGDKKIVQVGYGNKSNGAIPKTYSGNVSIPASVTYNNEQYMVSCIGDFAFDGCTNLANVTIPNSVKTISDYAFYGCKSLSNIDIPNSVTTIGVQAFLGCENFTMITIPESVTSIGEIAFASCSSLTSIEIPNSLTYIGCQAFDYTPWYRNYIHTIDDGMVYFGKVAYRYKGNISNNTVITLKEGTISISGYAFYEQTNLTSIELPNSIRVIGNGAFYGCSNLKSINIPENVETIEGAAFCRCSSLNIVDIPTSVTSIGSNAFYGCSSLTSIVIPDGVTQLGSGVFSGCHELINVKLPRYLSSIGDDTFKECSKLSTVTIPQGVSSIGNGAFWGCISLDSISIPNTVIIIEANAFYGCYKLGKIVFEDGENYLQFNNRPNGYVSYTFKDCHFQKVYNGRQFSWQYTSPFEDCTVDTLIIGANNAGRIPCSYLKVTKQVTAFSGNFSPSNLTTIVVEDGNEVYDSRDSCNAVIETKTNTLVLGCVSTKIPNSIEAIGNEAFLGCVLKNIDIPQGVQKIGSNAFTATQLESIKIPKSVVYIGDNSFCQCYRLKHVYCYNMPTTFASNIFAGTDIGNTTLYVPSTLIEAFKMISPWKDFGKIESLPSFQLIYYVDGEMYKTIKIEEGEAITPEPAPTKEGYTFSGWSEIPETMPASDVTISGTFTINKYKLTYMVDGEVIKSYDVEFGATITPEAEPTKEGYTFSGWSEIPTTMPAHDVTVTGTFTQETGINQIMVNQNGKAMIFTIDGKRVDNLKKGLNVIRMKDGTMRKVVVK